MVVLPYLANEKKISVIDAKKELWRIKLEESHSFLTTFWIPFGRFK